MNRMRWPLALALILSLGLFAAACQPGADNATTGEQPTTGDAATTAPKAPAGGDAAMGGLGGADKPIVMSFVPSGDSAEITAGADDIKALLETATGMTFKTTVATSYAAVIEDVGAGNAHVAWLPTLSYILAHEKFGVEPILVVGRFGSTTYASQIITKADSGIASLADLKGKTFCRPDALSTSGWVVPSVLMAASGVHESDLGKVVDAGGHDGVVKAVYNGDCDAGATFVDARTQVEEEFPDVSEKIVVIATSDAIPNDNVSVIKDLPADLVAKVRDGLLAVLKTEAGAKAMKTTYGVEALEPADDTFYDTFRVTLDKSGIDVGSLIKE